MYVNFNIFLKKISLTIYIHIGNEPFVDFMEYIDSEEEDVDDPDAVPRPEVLDAVPRPENLDQEEELSIGDDGKLIFHYITRFLYVNFIICLKKISLTIYIHIGNDHLFIFLDYQDILRDLSKQWLLIEINHRVSKEATNDFWSVANKMFHAMYVAKGDFGRKVPQFPVLRERLYDNNTPRVHMDIAYQSKEDDGITVVRDVTSAPSSRFPPSTHRKLFEIASVDVRIFFNFMK